MSTIETTGVALSLSVTLVTASWGQCRYEVTILEAPPCPFTGPPPIIPRAINQHGHVVGSYADCVSSGSEAFLWTPQGGLKTLDRPAGASSATAEDLNDAGVIVGNLSNPATRGFVYDEGAWTLLPPAFGGIDSFAHAINNCGQVVGSRHLGEAAESFSAFIWSESSGFSDLGQIDGVQTIGRHLNNHGVVVGYRGIAIATDEAFLWSDEQLGFIGPIPGGTTSNPTCVNDSAIVVGVGVVRGSSSELEARAFRWQDHEMVVLDTVDSDHRSCGAFAINSVGQIVGACFLPGDSNDRRAFIWQHGQIHDLTSLTEVPTGLVIGRAFDLNDAGWIVGDGFFPGQHAGVLLRPIDRPPADLDGDCGVGVTDLQMLLGQWSQSGLGDLDANGVVDVDDLIGLLLQWTESDHAS